MNASSLDGFTYLHVGQVTAESFFCEVTTFVIRQYKKVIFDVYDYPFFLEAEIVGQIKTKRTKDADENECCGFEFFVKNVKEKRDMNSDILIATIIK